MSDEIIKSDKNKPKRSKFKERTKRLRNKDHEGGLKHRTSLELYLDSDYLDKIQENNYFTELSDLEEVLKKSRTGRSLLEQSVKSGVELFFDEQVSVSQFYPKERIITLNPNHPKAELTILLTKELRRSWQYEQNILFNPLGFDPDEAILLNRTQQADVLLMAIRVAWELKLNEYSEIWDYMISSSVSDVMKTFEVHARSDFRTLNNGKATRAAYEQWFENSRIKIHDKSIIHQMLLDEKVYASDKKEYKSTVNDGMLIQLAEMPCGENYLSLSGYKQPTHEDYSSVDDRSNANFLWFIKFERSFQEKERQMLEESVTKSADIVDFFKKSEEIRQRPQIKG